MQADQTITAPPLPGHLIETKAPTIPITDEPPRPNKTRSSSGVKRGAFAIRELKEKRANAIAKVMKFTNPPALPNIPSTAAVDKGFRPDVIARENVVRENIGNEFATT